jgi:hypothetical protein
LKAQKGILQPKVVPPSLLIYALTQSTPALPKDTAAPFPLGKGLSHLVFKISDVILFVNDDTVGYVIT